MIQTLATGANYKRELLQEEKGHDITAKYFRKMVTNKNHWTITWRDMGLKHLLRMTRLKGCKFKALAISDDMAKNWNEDVESIQDKNQLMQTENVMIVSCEHLSSSEAYGFATVQEAQRFANLVDKLISKGIDKRSAISLAYNHIEKF